MISSKTNNNKIGAQIMDHDKKVGEPGSSQNWDEHKNDYEKELVVAMVKSSYRQVMVDYLVNYDLDSGENMSIGVSADAKQRLINELDHLMDKRKKLIMDTLTNVYLEFDEYFNFLEKFYFDFKWQVESKFSINLGVFLKNHCQISYKVNVYYNVVLVKIVDILLNYKVKLYQRFLRGKVLRNVDWYFDLEHTFKVQEDFVERLFSEFENELKIFFISRTNCEKYLIELANLLKPVSGEFERGLNLISAYQKRWKEFNPGHVPYVNKIWLQANNDKIMFELFENIQGTKLDWCENAINTLYQMLLKKNHDNLSCDLEIAGQLLIENVQGEFERYLKTDLFSEFQTWKMFNTLSDGTVKKLEAPYYQDVLETNIFVEYQAKMKSELDDRLIHYSRKQKYLFEKVINIKKKCCEQSVEYYFNLATEQSQISSDKDQGDESRSIQKAFDHAENIANDLKDDFNGEYFRKIINEINDNIESEIHLRKLVMNEDQDDPRNQSIYMSCVQDWSEQDDMKMFLRNMCTKVKNILVTNNDISGILRQQIEKDIESTVKMLASDESDPQVLEIQANHLNNLCTFLK